MGIPESLYILSFSVSLGQVYPRNRRSQFPGSRCLSPVISLSWLWGPWGQVPAGICPSGHRRRSLPFPGPDPGWGPRGLLRAQCRCLLRLPLERHVGCPQTAASPFLAPGDHGEGPWMAGGGRGGDPERFLEYAGCWGGRDSPGSCSGNGRQEGGVPETPAVMEVFVERAPEPSGCLEVGGRAAVSSHPS